MPEKEKTFWFQGGSPPPAPTPGGLARPPLLPAHLVYWVEDRGLDSLPKKARRHPQNTQIKRIHQKI